MHLSRNTSDLERIKEQKYRILMRVYWHRIWSTVSKRQLQEQLKPTSDIDDYTNIQTKVLKRPEQLKKIKSKSRQIILLYESWEIR